MKTWPMRWGEPLPRMLEAIGEDSTDVLRILDHLNVTDANDIRRMWADAKIRLQRIAVQQAQTETEPNGEAGTPEPAEQGGTDDGAPEPNGGNPRATGDEEGMMSVRKYANRFGVSYNSLRKRLDRYRNKNHNGWIQASDSGANGSRYLYAKSVALPIIDDLQARWITTNKRPAKKI